MKGINKRKIGNEFITDIGKDKVIISSEYYGNDRPSYICSICNQTLVRLTDAGMNNQTYWCRNCSVEYDPTQKNIRKQTKISVPDRNIEPAVATTPTMSRCRSHSTRT
jgi:DNA-directed RNA polymerase subunit RPC12/RpoP